MDKNLWRGEEGGGKGWGQKGVAVNWWSLQQNLHYSIHSQGKADVEHYWERAC